MIAFDILLAFSLTCALIEATPGPNMGYLSLISAVEGRRAGYVAILGVALGLLLVGLAAALGVTVIVTNSPFLYHALRWAGVVYLFWLAYDSWRDSAQPISRHAGVIENNIKYFRRGLITNLLNPKAAVFYVAILPTFVDVNHAVLPQSILLTIIYVFLATVIHASIVTLAGSARRFLADDRRQRRARRIFAVLLGLIAIWFGFSTVQ